MQDIITTREGKDVQAKIIEVTWCGLASFFIPGLGQDIAGEWDRGVLFFGTYVAIGALGAVMLEGTEGISGVVGAGLLLINDIWCIVDAVKVAKIKNMYMQDIRKMRAGVDISVTPSLAFVPAPIVGLQSLAAGLSLNLKF